MASLSPPGVTLDGSWKHFRHNGHFDRLFLSERCIGAVEDSKDASLSCPETLPLTRRCVDCFTDILVQQTLGWRLRKHRSSGMLGRLDGGPLRAETVSIGVARQAPLALPLAPFPVAICDGGFTSKCAHSGHSPTAWRTGQIDPLRKTSGLGLLSQPEARPGSWQFG
jgi:hypothetical protein